MRWRVMVNDEKFELPVMQNICIDEKQGWFIDENTNLLFNINFENRQYTYIDSCASNIRDKEYKEAYDPLRCLAYKDKIFLFSHFEKKIFIYHTVTKRWTHIDIQSLTNETTSCSWGGLVIYNGRIYAVHGKKNILFEIDPEKENMLNVLKIIEGDDVHAGPIKYEDGYIYVLDSENTGFSSVNLETKEIVHYAISCREERFTTISKVKDDVFCFTGFHQGIYIWNQRSGDINVIKDFPDGIKVYRKNDNKMMLDKIREDKIHYFTTSIGTRDQIWFIPHHSNEVIYMDKKTYRLSILPITDEMELVMNRTYRQHKYIPVYLNKNRYIGLYSVKNRVLLEIDTKEIDVNLIDIVMDENETDRVFEAICCFRSLFLENYVFDIRFFKRCVIKNSFIVKDNYVEAGHEIYKRLSIS